MSDQLCDCHIESSGEGLIQITSFDWKHMAVTRQERRLIEQCADLATVECCGHDQQAKVGSEEPLRFTTESKSQVGLDAALMEFIENDDSIGLKRRILLQQPGQHPLGHDLESRVRPHFSVESHAVADGFSKVLLTLLCHVASGGSCRKSPWFKQ